MSGPCVEQLKNLGQTFKILRATPVSQDKLWVAAAPNIPYVKNTTCGGIVAGNKRPGVLGVGWTSGISTALADSTVLVIYDAVTGKLNYGLTQSNAEAFFASNDATESVQATCLYDICSGDRPNVLLCADLPEADGVLQFIAQLCASPAISYFGEGLSLTIAKPSFYDPTNGVNAGCPGQGNTFLGCGNWSNFSFNIGACGGCTADVDLIYIGSIVDSSSEECQTTICQDKEYTEGNTFIYAPVKFTLTNRDGQKQSFKRACYIKIEPLNTCFNVFFAQTRNCDSAINILIISCLVDLSCLYWGGSVYIITSPRARYTIPPL
jgi:hypothetical protein